MKNCVLLLLLLLTSIGYSQNASLSQGTTVNEDYYTEVAFEYVNGKIIIPVKIDNVVYKFIVDTGAPNCISKKMNGLLNPKVLKTLNVKDGNNNKSEMNVVQLPNLEIGGIVFQNSVALSSNDEKNYVFDCFNIDGFIGSNLLRNSIIQIDTKAKLLRITNDPKQLNFKKKNGQDVLLVGDQCSPYIWIKMKDSKSAREQVLLDTGMRGFYDISTRNYNLLKNENIIKVINNGVGTKDIGLFGNANSNEQLRVMVPEIAISNSKFINVISVTTNDNNSRIGIDLFEYGIGTLDYMHKKFYFDDYTEGPIAMKEKVLGFSPTILDNKLVVGIVWDEKLKDKIHTGDEIIELDGKNYENYQICDLITQDSIFKDVELKEFIVKTKSGELVKVTP